MAELPDSPAVSLSSATALYSCLVHLARATLELAEAKDCAILAGLDPSGVASIDVAHKIAEGLVREAGRGLTTLRNAPDSDVKRYVEMLLDRFQPGWRQVEHATEGPE